MFEMMDGETPAQRREGLKRQRKEFVDHLNQELEELRR